jgi:5-methylcytosine-specific restriction endonuclease McrA
MSLALTIEAMTIAGCSPEQIVAAAKFIEAKTSELSKRTLQNQRAYAKRTAEIKDDVSAKEWSELRWRVVERDGYACSYCKRQVDDKFHCDHVIPRSKGGKSELDNLAVACKNCNSSKKDLLISEWGGPRGGNG